MGSVETPAGIVPQISSNLTFADRWGSIKARWSFGRMHFIAEPGLYALGSPDDKSPVLVTANYKMSFDQLRRALPGLDAWILVLDTKGINVWCAAGKRTFGTEELVNRIAASQLDQVVSHRKVILPQLGGPGVAAHSIKKLSGFEAVFGPIKATDVLAYLAAGMRARPEMRRKTFPMRERAVLIPVELVDALKWALIAMPILFLASGLGGPDTFWTNALHYGVFAVIAILIGVFAGAVMTPILLPWLPGRAFTTKGLAVGLAAALILVIARVGELTFLKGGLDIFAWVFIVPAIAAFLAMNFTGASTYTSLSGVKKEMKWGVPVEIALGAIGLCLWVGSRFVA